jgi:hypothetical protein
LQHRLLGQKIAKMLKKDTLSASDWGRMKEIGFDESSWAEMQKELSHIDIKSGFHVDKWMPGNREKLAEVLHRGNAQAIQKQLAGETYEWTHSLFGGLLSQFRMFPFTAIEKQGFRAWKMADKEVAATAMYGMALSSAMYMTKVHLNATKIEERKRKKYIEKHLKPEHMLLGSIQLIGMLGPVGDLATITRNMAFSGDNMSAQYGVGGSQSSLLDLIPASRTVETAGHLVTGAVRTATTGKVDNATKRAYQQLNPLRNTLYGQVITKVIQEAGD